MLGSICGDFIGSVYESNPLKSVKFQLVTPRNHFTDDTVLTMAVARAILLGSGSHDYARCILEFAREFPNAGYGGNFARWMRSQRPRPYGSWGNGSAMRVSPVGMAFETEEDVLTQAQASAEVTHNHPEGVKGAQAVALGVFMARKGRSKEEIKKEIESRFDYDLDRKLDEIRPGYTFNISCQKTVPESIIAFLESTDYESTVRNAVSLGGDSDTMACMAGGIAEAFYGGIPKELEDTMRDKLPKEFVGIIDKFYAKYGTYEPDIVEQSQQNHEKAGVSKNGLKEEIKE